MQNNKFYSLRVAKQLKEWGCDVESEIEIVEYCTPSAGFLACLKDKKIKSTSTGRIDRYYSLASSEEVDNGIFRYVYRVARSRAYHFLEDICCTHAVEFFGEDIDYPAKIYQPSIERPKEIFELIQQNKFKDAEDYFLEHTIFNPENQ